MANKMTSLSRLNKVVLCTLPLIAVISCTQKATPSTPATQNTKTYSNHSGTSYSSYTAYSNHPVRTATYRDRSVSMTNLSADIINYVNEYRRSKGLSSLKLLNVANTQAGKHSQDMASKKVPFGHSGFNTRAVVIANQLKGTSSTGENVAFGKMTAREVVQAWLKSPAHRQNIEGNFNYTGVGVARDSRGYIYYTQMFVKK